jgi:hypothetical protein
MFRKGMLAIEDADANLGCTETRDGMVIEGESFFNSFQLESED